MTFPHIFPRSSDVPVCIHCQSSFPWKKSAFLSVFCKRKETCGDVVSEDAAELKIVWLRMKNRLAENDFSIGADFFVGLLSGTWSLKVRRKEESLSVPVTKGTNRLL